MVSDNPASKIESFKNTKKLPKYLNEEEINKLLNFKCKSKYDYRNKALLELMYSTGMRVSEIVNLKVSEVDLYNSVIRTITKGNKERIIIFGEIANYYLKEYIDTYRDLLIKKDYNTEYVLLNNKGTRLTRQGFYINLENIVRSVGISKEISPHTIRHSFAMHLVNNGADLKSVQEMLGHSDISTTQIYMKANANTKLMEVYDKSHPRAHVS